MRSWTAPEVGCPVLVVDSQIHPYAPRGAGEVAPAGQRTLTPDLIIGEMDRAGVDRAVLVPPRVDVATTNEFAVAAQLRWPDRFGVMGKLLLDRPESQNIANAWTRSQMLGFRVSFPRGQFSPTDTEWLWRAAEERGFPLMVWVPGQLAELKEAAQRHPRAHVIVDHLGMAPSDRGDGVDAVVKALVTLANLDNVAVKASSLPAHSAQGFPFADLHPYVREVTQCFGVARVFWGSDLTTLDCAYEDAVRMFTDAMPFLAGRDLEEVMGLGLCRWLQWRV